MTCYHPREMFVLKLSLGAIETEELCIRNKILKSTKSSPYTQRHDLTYGVKLKMKGQLTGLTVFCPKVSDAQRQRSNKNTIYMDYINFIKVDIHLIHNLIAFFKLLFVYASCKYEIPLVLQQ